MKQYISIPRTPVDIPIYGWDKLDGSQIRCEVNRKHGLHKFGSRKVLVGPDHKFLGRAEELARARYGDSLPRILKDERWEEMTAYFEFYGPRSFAGTHHPDDEHEVRLIDVSVYKKGFMLPGDFYRTFTRAGVPTAALLYEGRPNAEFLAAVRNGTLPGMTYEGVVCKGAPTKKGYPPTMFKIKSDAWVERVKALYGSDPAALEDLL